jgi:hypothetical protein
MKDYRTVIKTIVADLCDQQAGYSSAELNGAAVALCAAYDLTMAVTAVRAHLKRECVKYERMSTPLSQQLKPPFGK